MVLIEEDAVLPAWTWYGHSWDIAAKLFTIEPNFYGKLVVAPKTIKQMIMLFDFNIFPISTIPVKHLITGLTYVE